MDPSPIHQSLQLNKPDNRPRHLWLYAMTWIKMSVRPRVTRFNPRALVLGVLLTVSVGAGIAIVINTTALPDTVDSLTVDNRTEFPLGVEVRGGEGESWLGVGTVPAGESKAFPRVLDQGQTWLVRFSAQGETSNQYRFSRQDLVVEDWTLNVPDTVTEDLRANGVEPPP